MARVRARWAPPVQKTVAQWAEQKRYLNEKNSDFPGPFRFDLVPFIREPLEALSDPHVHEVCAQKSAQITWTDGVVCNWLGYIADEDPSSVIVLFPADRKCKEFNIEKFEPMVEVTPVLATKLTTKSRAKENTQTYKAFPGGFIKFIGSNSPSNLKSTSARRLIVEEPDDCNLNIKGQGDSITLLEERGKGFLDRKILAGGTPSIAGFSSIAKRMELTDQRHWHVPCHECGHAESLRWEQVKYGQDPAQSHPVYGPWKPETARYCCPGCGVLWTNDEKNANVRRGRWVATAEFRGRRGYYLNELMSPFHNSRLELLAEKYLAAKHELDTAGDATKLIVFSNATLGLCWEFKGAGSKVEDLEARCEDYPEWFVPWPALALTVGVDVQHERLVVTVYAWGEGEESWLVWAGEFHGNVLEPGVWSELERSAVFRSYRHVSGVELNVSAVSVDAGDGQTADAVYKWCRAANRRWGVPRAMPIKGARGLDADIFRKPGAPLDVDAQHKGAKYGLRPYMVGVNRAKDLLLGVDEQAGRINLKDADGKTGRGPGRTHWYRGVRPDFFDQLTAEVKAPARLQSGAHNRFKKLWQVKAGKQNHFLDATVYALHAVRALRLDTWSAAQWEAFRKRIMQGQLFTPDGPAGETTGADAAPSGAPDGTDAGPVSAPAAAGAQPESPRPVAPRQAARANTRRMRSAGVQR
jgi:phage terminase large subunit GpA-like protein